MSSGFGAGGGGAPSGAAGGALTGTYPNPGLAGQYIPFWNLLTNPGFNFVQLFDPTIANIISDNSVSADAWKVTRQNANVTYQRLSNSGVGGWQSANRGRFTKTVGAGKFMVYQPLESLITLAMQNGQITFTVKLNLSAPHTIRIGFFTFTGGAPNSAVTAPVAAWNGANVLPTLNAGFAYQFSFALSLAAGLNQMDVTFVSGTFGANDILCPFILTDEAFAAADFVDIGECVLNSGFTDGNFTYRPLGEAEDIKRVERFIEKSYDLDTLPGTATLTNSRGLAQVGAACLFGINYRQQKVLNGGPAITLFSPVTGLSGDFADITAGVDTPVATADIGNAGFNVTSVAAADNDQIKGHYLINGSL